MAKEISLKYGCNPNQVPSRIFMKEGELPLQVLNGRPGYINFLDAFNSWQLVRELKMATGLPAAASFKHVSPAGAAVYVPLSDTLKKIYFVDDLELSPIASAYAAARGADRMSSYGDWAALSDVCDKETATLLAREVSDGIIAPGYTDEALAILKTKRKGNYNVVQIDESYVPAPIEHKDVFGVTFEQGRNELKIDASLLEDLPTANKNLTDEAKRDLIVSLITLKYTQSNSVCYVKNGQAIGVGAGQQSRVHCTRLAGNKADNWYLRQSPRVLELPFKPGLRRPDRDNTIDVYISDDYMDVLADGQWENFFTEKPQPFTREQRRQWLDGMTGVALGSDAFFPFGDNIERAHKSGVQFIAQPGGSIRDDNVIEVCDRYGIAMAFTGLRLFHH
ncbi:phosphoribosylaminoimidazolecarboxamide formyltransferase [Acutalibacter muris]|jgi:AICAR transformylase/IMP cyclohydrolase PurH|uniref:5-aminoimidazole-4-carboxamide ribonucleotide transformylase n=1 Tax=Acutalibacter muris TaxID=1796620 RepID=A0A1Z2XRZ3_9FIRM|nr:phosphoribosylaminoimidazolecarboxamide formyltransferase [Acutalibacter muris]ANU55536.1 5-aminoimidazole-4-carboxamide ribonucleotide transformylase [Hungateiclostridiaceae bacterium KB18]ASB41223.1 5-aminoimidazole-4-carboxamide ribonucleotide transformylase [Acutalibacter muris]MCI9192317.1 phosphoribosylaminoimidazolecarboxamide formyltransferase [Acutalibacter muris]QQR30496.1 phosphoribosylaminoimidazolecarboxamide formyltransferase [Acutalibacter muris]